VRYRDIKHTIASPYPREEVEAARKLDAELKAEARIRRRQHKRQKMALLNPDRPEPINSPEGRKRGPKPDLSLQKCEHGLHTQLTKREYQALEALRKERAPHVTRSTFLRFLISEILEKARRKDCPTMPFFVDLNSLHEACTLGRKAACAPRAPARGVLSP